MAYEKNYEEEGLLARRRSASSSSNGSEYLLDGIEDIVLPHSFSASRYVWWPLRQTRTRRNSRSAFRLWRKRPLRSRIWSFFRALFYLLIAILLTCAIVFPSYTAPPRRYLELRNRVAQSSGHGAANMNNEKIFIAASLYDKDGRLLSGHWRRSVSRLIDLLGPDNVFLSIYENDPDEKSVHALDVFRKQLPCESSLIIEHLDLEDLPHIVMPDGSQRLKRIAFLAEVRNRVLRPLDDANSKAYSIAWDKLLYLNDVAFDPVDAANLLFNTNVDEATGKTDYRSACAVDFINPFKFYDTFATRDLEGYSMGVPFYPWFTSAGHGESRQDVLQQKDAIRVKSCWGGMVAFEAKWFQPHLYDLFEGDLVLPESIPIDNDENNNVQDETQLSPAELQDGAVIPRTSTTESPIPPLRFRFEPDTYWDASECCLIQADLAHLPLATDVGPNIFHLDARTGIYMNPYVRVAYSNKVLAWLWFTKRFERLYTPVHSLINWIGSMPKSNPRRLELPGEEVVDRVWRWDDASQAVLRNGSETALAEGLHGSFHDVTRVAKAGQFCGSRKLLFIKNHPKDGEGPWGSAKVPRD